MLIVNTVRYVISPGYNVMEQDSKNKYLTEPEQTIDQFCDLLIKHEGHSVYRIEQPKEIENYFNCNVAVFAEILKPMCTRYRISNVGIAWFLLPSGRVLATCFES